MSDMEKSGHCLGIRVAHGIQENFANHCVVWHHHGDGSKEDLEIVRKFGAARIARVHCDKWTASHSERQIGALKHEPLRFSRLGLLDGQDLLCDHGEHLKLNAIELIKTCPSPRGGEALEEFPIAL